MRQFEKSFSEQIGCAYTVGVTSCTAALHLSLLANGIGPGDEVITTPMTFIATATAIIQAGATPIFADVEKDTGNIDVKEVESKITSRTKAVIPVHLYGQMVDMLALEKVCSPHGIKIIEDSAHCITGSRDGISPGEIGSTACFSFYATKHLTSGEGGAISTNDSNLYERLCILRNHGMTKDADERAREGYKDWDMVMMGWKYNMSNIDAAFLLPQLPRLRSNHEKLKKLVERYSMLFQEINSVTMPSVRNDLVHAHHLFPVLIHSMSRNDFIAGMHAKGIGVVVNYQPVHLMSYFRQEYKHRVGDFPAAEEIGKRVVSLPLFPRMTNDDVDVVVRAVRETLSVS